MKASIPELINKIDLEMKRGNIKLVMKSSLEFWVPGQSSGEKVCAV